MAEERRLTVILGAGSSHDCAGTGSTRDKGYTPPLTPHLFDEVYGTILSKYPGAQALSDEIRTRVLRKEGLEAVLGEFAQLSNVNVRRQYWQVAL